MPLRGIWFVVPAACSLKSQALLCSRLRGESVWPICTTLPNSSAKSGDIEILLQGSPFGSTATEVYEGNVAFNTVSTTAKINLANHRAMLDVAGGSVITQ